MATATKKPKRKPKPPDIVPVPLPPPVVLPPGLVGILSREQLCEVLQVSPRQVSKLIVLGQIPRADVRVGASPRWSVGLINQALANLPPYDSTGVKPPARNKDQGQS
jgi:hypothetical protein